MTAAPDGSPPVDPRVQLALSRLTDSRVALRHALLPEGAAGISGLGQGLLPRPWRVMVRALRARASPWIRQHPITATAAAAALGGVLVGLRPWRWPLMTAGLQAAGQQVLRWTGALLSQPSTQIALASLLTSLAAQAMRSPPDPVTPPSAPP